MTPIVIEGADHHCDLHARLMFSVANAANRRSDNTVPLSLRISSDREWVRIDDQRDLCLEATNYDEDAAEDLRAVVLDLVPEHFLTHVREAVAEASPEHFTVIHDVLKGRGMSSFGGSRMVAVAIKTVASTGVVVTLTVDKLDAMLAVPLVMLVVDELCRANLWATVVLNTNVIPSTVAVAA